MLSRRDGGLLQSGHNVRRGGRRRGGRKGDIAGQELLNASLLRSQVMTGSQAHDLAAIFLVEGRIRETVRTGLLLGFLVVCLRCCYLSVWNTDQTVTMLCMSPAPLMYTP